MNHCIKIAVIFLLFGIARVGSGAPSAPFVTSSTIDYGLNQISVRGTNLGSVAPTVQLKGVQLIVVSYTSGPPEQVVVAVLPAGLTAGTYRLVVTLGNNQMATADVTYGAIGPQGPTGPQGA